MNQINPLKLLQLNNSWEQFKKRHPKLPAFISAVSQDSITEGSIVDITITNADGKVISSNLKLTAEDIQLIKDIKDISSGT